MKRRFSDELEKQMPESYRRLAILGAILAPIGASLGWIFFGRHGDVVLFIVTIIGIELLGVLFGIIFGNKLSSRSLAIAEQNVNRFLIVLGFLMTALGLFVFAATGKLIGIVGAVFFGLGSIYLWKKFQKRGEVGSKDGTAP